MGKIGWLFGMAMVMLIETIKELWSITNEQVELDCDGESLLQDTFGWKYQETSYK